MQPRRRKKTGESVVNLFSCYSLDPPPLMAANHNADNDYSAGLSAAGIIYNGNDGIPRFKNRRGWTRTLFPPQFNHPINICSSSYGLIACYDPTSNTYYIGNPEIPNSLTPLPPTPWQHNPLHTDAVLVYDFYLEHVYHLVCAVFHRRGVYNLDVYSSVEFRWLQTRTFRLVSNIIRNTGVSCGRCAYWLTEAPQFVIRFDISDRSRDMPWRSRLPERILGSPGTMLQLGRVGNKLGLVTLDASFTGILYLLEQGGRGEFFHPYRTFRLPIIAPIPNVVIRLIRFQSFKAEVFILFDRLLLLWEDNIIYQPNNRPRIVNIGEEQVGYGLAHVVTPLLPLHQKCCEVHSCKFSVICISIPKNMQSFQV